MAATNRNLTEEVGLGRFRSDVYYRLNVFPIPLPPLREHLDDLPVLVQALLEDINRKHGSRVTDLSPQALERLSAHDWPGNVRELRNLLERAVILAGQGTIQLEHLPAQMNGGMRTSTSAAASAAGSTTVSVPAPDGSQLLLPVGITTVEQAERALIERTLEFTAQNKTRAAEILGISQKTLFNKLKEYAAQGD